MKIIVEDCRLVNFLRQPNTKAMQKFYPNVDVKRPIDKLEFALGIVEGATFTDLESLVKKVSNIQRPTKKIPKIRLTIEVL